MAADFKLLQKSQASARETPLFKTHPVKRRFKETECELIFCLLEAYTEMLVVLWCWRVGMMHSAVTSSCSDAWCSHTLGVTLVSQGVSGAVIGVYHLVVVSLGLWGYYEICVMDSVIGRFLHDFVLFGWEVDDSPLDKVDKLVSTLWKIVRRYDRHRMELSYLDSRY
ncbi:hypothetical protein Tco_1113282 [Tanacetum coccineum]|uniref:Uncharacterized protein n=1 Tax=Tanacetum coccineum TaxID=301880 RepID=A0ABQ5IS08_9ASTR